MELYGKEITKREITKRVGDMSQLADAREGTLSYGKADGVRVIDVKAGELAFTVVPSRGMDIAWASYKGVNVSYMGKPGVTGAQYFEKDGLNFLRGFFAGLMTTCGLTYMGAACCDEGTELGLHGRISNTPAYDVGVSKEWEGDGYVVRIRGKVPESATFFENMVLTREITVRLGESCLHIHDHIENCGSADTPLMVLYHCNFGYPIVSEDTVLIEPAETEVSARDAEAEKGINNYKSFEEPTRGYSEQVFYHDFSKTRGDFGYACLYNTRLNMGAYVKFDKRQTPNFAQWKMMGENEYAVGLEPSNCMSDGRDKVRSRGELTLLTPGETRDFDLTIGIVESEDVAASIR